VLPQGPTDVLPHIGKGTEIDRGWIKGDSH
jgi:hypothetical protein